MGLTDQQQAALLALAFILPAVSTWFGLGAPTDHAALAMLGGAIVGGIVAYIKEMLGGAAPKTTTTTVPPSSA